MADLINLRRARKQKARKEAADTAAANRAKHGQTKPEKALNKAKEEQSERMLEGHRLNDDDAPHS